MRKRDFDREYEKNSLGPDIEERIAQAKKIEIVSGEGIVGTKEIYTGKRTLRALKMRAKKERCEGDRWCTVWIDDCKTEI